jgi:hypothetical protein
MRLPMSIYWMKTADVYPDGGYGPDNFMVSDPAVCFAHTHQLVRTDTSPLKFRSAYWLICTAPLKPVPYGGHMHR